MKKFIAFGYRKLFEDSKPRSQVVCVNANTAAEAATVALETLKKRGFLNYYEHKIMQVEELTADKYSAIEDTRKTLERGNKSTLPIRLVLGAILVEYERNTTVSDYRKF